MGDIMCCLQCLKASDGTRIETVQTADIKDGLKDVLQYAKPQICIQRLKFNATAAILCVVIFNTQDSDILNTSKCHGGAHNKKRFPTWEGKHVLSNENTVARHLEIWKSSKLNRSQLMAEDKSLASVQLLHIM